MFVADVKCSQATWQTVPNLQTDSAKAVSEAVVRTWHRTRYQRKTGIKRPVLRLMELHLRATECHLPYGITHLPPDTSEHTPL